MEKTLAHALHWLDEEKVHPSVAAALPRDVGVVVNSLAASLLHKEGLDVVYHDHFSSTDRSGQSAATFVKAITKLDKPEPQIPPELQEMMYQASTSWAERSISYAEDHGMVAWWGQKINTRLANFQPPEDGSLGHFGRISRLCVKGATAWRHVKDVPWREITLNAIEAISTGCIDSDTLFYVRDTLSYWYRGAATVHECHVEKGRADVTVTEYIAWNHHDSPWLSYTENVAAALWFAVARARAGDQRVIAAIPDSSLLYWRLDPASGQEPGARPGGPDRMPTPRTEIQATAEDLDWAKASRKKERLCCRDHCATLLLPHREDDVPTATPPRKQAPRSPEPRAEALGGALYWPGEEGNAADRRRSPPRSKAPTVTALEPELPSRSYVSMNWTSWTGYASLSYHESLGSAAASPHRSLKGAFCVLAMLRVMGDMVFQGSFTAPVGIDLSGQVAVVTGPSRGGIGFETALGLAQRGAKVLLAARNVEKADADAAVISQEAGIKEKPQVIKCDVSSTQSVRDAASAILSQYPKIDILVDNAGAVFDDAKTVENGIEITFATCVLGHHLLNYLLKPRRLVWVTGDIYAIADGTADPFHKGKGIPAYANACLSRILLARETKSRTSGEVISVHPGVIQSQFIKANNCCEGIGLKMMNCSRITVNQGAQASLHAATIAASELPTGGHGAERREGKGAV
eukprot:s1222_g7.t2